MSQSSVARQPTVPYTVLTLFQESGHCKCCHRVVHYSKTQKRQEHYDSHVAERDINTSSD